MTNRFSKKGFFDALQKLDDFDDFQDEDDDSIEKLLISSRPSRASDSTAARISASTRPISLRRSITEPQPSPAGGSRQVFGVADKGNIRRTVQATESKVRTVKRAQTTGTMPVLKTGGHPAKKRKTESLKLVPENQQIFKGLSFFFFPNNDIAPSRRLRIQRAREYGAKWAQEWTGGITHVIVDKGLLYQDLLTHIKAENLTAQIAVVNETYPSECIRFRSVLSTLQVRFRVDGTPTATDKEEPTVATQTIYADTLPLKPSRRTRQKSPETSQSNNETAPVEPPPGQPAQVTEDGADTHGRDSLDDIIDETKAVRHLPLDTLDSDEEFNDQETDDESEPKEPPNKKQHRPPGEHKTGDSWTQNFACMQKYDPNAKGDSPNSRTIEILQQMLDYYTRTADQWRTLAYRKAIGALRRQPQMVATRAQALAIPGIGTRLADKIEEIVLTDHLRRLDHTKGTTEDRIIQKFLGIYGVGLVQASRWVAQGYRSLEDLRERAPLSKNQRVGVERYHDFAQRIPRKEVEEHGAIVRRAVQAVDKDMQVVIAGSYRRGALDSGDIDLLITKPDASLEQIQRLIMNIVIPQLFDNGFLQVGLATSRHNHDASKWHGASALPGNVWRRIDLLLVPGAEFGAAILYFTGNDIFNRSMRLLARKKGMSLNQRGLYTDVLHRAGVKINPGRLLEGRDERRIFATLGVPWRPPEHRIC
ncbi:DNA polymerase family X [Penicillium cinerascens]|uniref:DNA polymerase lambda n=1 Tax=Penicillium cinerascens TaxID=70096 RepID=A0A9W9NEN8_9EURO|nr:DNA polymerase family X [Penicillium cinerascens]KAJ5218519.1 DNA polymerase family X [Penicillium cinerascens]